MVLLSVLTLISPVATIITFFVLFDEQAANNAAENAT
jgi:hypothetical protein